MSIHVTVVDVETGEREEAVFAAEPEVVMPQVATDR